MRNIGVILAGGNGSRFGGNLPKQFIKVAGKTIIEHTLDVFQKCESIDEVAIVINPSFTNEIETIVNNNQYNKVKKILLGGKERSDSSLAAINAYQDEENADEIKLIFHDAVRPFINRTIINEVIDSLSTCNAVDVAIKATDTIIEVCDKDKIVNVPNRDQLRQGQTPQAFRLKTIKKAYKKALTDPFFKATDDCGIVLKYLPEESITVVEGSAENIKITYDLDMFIADKLFQLKNQEFKTSDFKPKNFDQIKNKCIVIFGGSYGIGKDIYNICKEAGAQVFSFSRSENKVNVKIVEDVKKSLDEVYQTTGKINYIINTAAILNKEALVNVDQETAEEIIAVNFLGMVNVAKESFKYLKDTQGHLLLFTSSSYTRGRASYSLYSSTKAAAVNFTQAISEEWKNFGIRVNCINPERTRTPMRVKNFGNEPVNSLLKSEDVAKISIQTLLSDLTGQVVYIKK
ncbi:bifunctional cytidylyltransferase/SDR family oxidoreductase [Labilibaculum sp. DW002]|uniref:2-C-methyl-D-erythritol 4-phosphate cytidylyltransferase n=1 Tax=Paralabilibaculum antarcticum TaxID=2912572 RepID=A0ABT5VTB3_9BACT|nr:bifunctional cytidylyltransferase/SDR family oxidoreductase [Labilibaculum sp. DW002]MDE5418643.1 bifunctional cytidylyltransferase/SDR family oxidoreductase [Labilibaculum sp. DW002]